MSLLRRLGPVGYAAAILLVAGLVALVVGISGLPPYVEGTVSSDPTEPAFAGVYAGDVDRTELVAGTVLVALGGTLALIAAARR